MLKERLQEINVNAIRNSSSSPINPSIKGVMFSPTNQTISSVKIPSSPRNKIFFGKRVALRTMGFFAVDMREGKSTQADKVRLPCGRNKMFGINTSPVIAFMMDIKSIWDRTDENLVRCPVGKRGFPPKTKTSISEFVKWGEIPTASGGVFLNVFKKTLSINDVSRDCHMGIV